MSDIVDEIRLVIGNLGSLQELNDLVDQALSQEIPTIEIVEKGLRRGLELVGAKYSAGEYFLAELLYGSSMMESAMEKLEAKLDSGSLDRKGSILIGTVRGDMHDIGKNIFKMLVRAAGFEVTDLGVDVDSVTLLDRVQETQPDILGLSCLLTTALPEISTAVTKLNDAGLRKDLRVIIGGNAVTKRFGEEIAVDGAALDAVEGVNLCRGWMTQ